MVEFLPSKQAVAGSSPVSRFFLETVSLDRLVRPSQSNLRKQPPREAVFFLSPKAFNEHLPSFLVNTCLAVSSSTKVFPSSHRQVVPNWNCLPSHYRTFLWEKQVRQVFTQGFGRKAVCIYLGDSHLTLLRGSGKVQKQILRAAMRPFPSPDAPRMKEDFSEEAPWLYEPEKKMKNTVFCAEAEFFRRFSEEIR